MPYTIACHHHADGHRGRDPRAWGTWQEAAQAICDHVEAMAARACPPLEGEEVRYVLRIAAQAADTGIAELPGLVTFEVADTVDAPPLTGDPGLGTG
jgi:hypothetical protein